MIIEAVNVNDALTRGLQHLLAEGVTETSRNGDVLVAPGLVVTEYARPWERVLFNPVRDANPFFHAMEALWMLAGRNDVAFVQQYAQRMVTFSDDGETLWGAYGHRWRGGPHGRDQLRDVVEELRKNPDSRRAVIGMFHPKDDQIYLARARAGEGTAKDLPCNTHCYVDLRGGTLNMTILCRSNDVIWGAYGANAVHFSFLQEYLAAWLGAPCGTLRQVSNNFHIYLGAYPREKMAQMAAAEDAHMYDSAPSHLSPFDAEGGMLRFSNMLQPMELAWIAWKEKNPVEALRQAARIEPPDWRRACEQWLARHFTAYEARNAIG